MTFILPLGLFLYLVAIGSYLILNVKLFDSYYFKILSSYETQISQFLHSLNSSNETIQKLPVNDLLRSESYVNIITHYSLVTNLYSNLVLIILFTGIIFKKLNASLYFLSLLVLFFAVYPNYYFSKNLKPNFSYINDLSTLSYIALSASLFFLGIELLIQYRKRSKPII